MSANTPLACSGVPRDLGVAQGSARGYEVRERVGSARLWEGLRKLDPDLVRLDRDLWRHHPQLAERISGLCLSAGGSRRGFLRALAREGGLPSSAVALGAERPGSTPLLWRRFLPDTAGDAPEVRIERPEAGIPALVAAPVWLPAAVCGVNASGLAIAVSAPGGPPSDTERFRVPPLVLVTDCLQRFSDVEAALAWCQDRPSGGSAHILACDAKGELAGLALQPGRRQRLAPGDGLLLGSGTAATVAALEKVARDTPLDDPGSWATTLAGVGSPAPAVWLDPAARELGLASPGAPPRTFALEP